MAHYAYKHACYDIDYEKYKELVARFEKENECEHDGDSNYNGDNWYIMEMWIRELKAENESLREALASTITHPEDLARDAARFEYFQRKVDMGELPEPVKDAILNEDGNALISTIDAAILKETTK